MKRSITAALVLATLAVAQESTPSGDRLVVERRGAVHVVVGEVKGRTLKSLFVDIAGGLGLELKMAPGVLPVIAHERLDVTLDGMLVDEVLDHLAGVAGLQAHIGSEAVHLAPRSGQGLAEAAPEARERAGETWRRLGLHQLRRESPVALYRVGVLYYAGGDWSLALSAFRTFYETNGDDARVPRARLLAGFSAFQLGRFQEARSILTAIEDFHPDAPEILESTLLLARVYIAEGQPDEAILRLRRVASQVGDQRLRAHAILLRTRMWYERGEPEQALASIQDFDRPLERENPDLVDRVALAKGLCLVAAGRDVDTFVHLQHAWLTLEDPHRRLQAAIAMGDAWLALGDHLSALNIARLAGALDLEGVDVLRAQALEARVWRTIGIARRSEKALLAILRQDTERSPEGKRLLLQALGDLADLMFEQERFEEAVALFEELERVPDLEFHARVMRARCLRARGEHRSAIAILEDLPEDAAGVDRAEVVRLMGESWMALGEHDRATLVFLSGRQGENR